MAIKQLKMRNYIFQMYQRGSGEIDLYADKSVPDRHFLITFKDEKELDKFIQFLKSPIERMWNE
jgi:hypothetical protein